MRKILMILVATLWASFPANADDCPKDFRSESEIVDFVKHASGMDQVRVSIRDVQGNGNSDRIIGAACGNRVCESHVFLQQKSGAFHYVGYGTFHQDAFAALHPEGSHSVELLAYWGLGANDGMLIRYRSSGCGEFETVAKIVGTSDLFDFVGSLKPQH
jgi:hypothetical protein